jgi:aminoglycoside phosphotransferase (APT) family kinase protein
VKLLAAGRASAVYDLGDGRVLRQGGAPQREAMVMEHARAHGFPVPRVLEQRDDALVLEHVDGETMARHVVRRPTSVRAHAQVLADLHARLHAIAAPPDLAPAGEGRALLHLDLHPLNVLLSARGPVVIDWTNARSGPAELDLALTWVIGMTSDVPGVYPRALFRLFARLFARTAGRDAVARGAEAAAAFRLRDPNVNDTERARIRRLVDRDSRR